MIFKGQSRPLSPFLKTAYHLYFGCKIGDQDRVWAPKQSCNSCALSLTGWLKGTHKSMPFAVPMVWRKPRDHGLDCYFCLTNIKGFSKNMKHKIRYPNLDSARRPVKHDFCLPVPVPPDTYTLRSVSSDEEPAACEDVAQSSSAQSDPNYAPVPDINEPHVISQEELNDLIRDLDLPKSKALLLASRLQQWNLLNQNVNISMYRKREVRLVPNFTKDGDLVYCSDIPSLMGQLKYSNLQCCRRTTTLKIGGYS